MSKKPSNQKGLTLVELLVAMFLASMIAGAVVASIFQLFAVSDRNSDYNVALGQGPIVGYWFSRDGVPAQVVSVDDDLVTPEFELITLDWVEWVGTPAYRVVYTLEGSGALKDLKRTYSIDGITQQSTVIAQYIDPASTSSTWDGAVLTLVITAEVGDQSVTRTYKVEPRSIP